MKRSKLYIIGNGFDLHHGIKSSYKDFREYLGEVDPEIVGNVEKYLHLSEPDHWNYLEEAFAGLEPDDITDEASDFLMSYASDKWSDSYHHAYPEFIDGIVRSLSVTLLAHFADWVGQLEIPKNCKSPVSNFDVDARFLNFNYTNSLVEIYGVPINHVTHIHGSVEGNAEEIVLGHCWTPSEGITHENYEQYEDNDPRVNEGIESINGYFKKTFKPTEEIIGKNSSFFTDLNTVEEIVILGHSLSDVDREYFRVIVKNIDTQAVSWFVSVRNPSSEAQAKRFFSGLGIPNSNVNFFNMAKSPVPSNLTIACS